LCKGYTPHGRQREKSHGHGCAAHGFGEGKRREMSGVLENGDRGVNLGLGIGGEFHFGGCSGKRGGLMLTIYKIKLN